MTRLCQFVFVWLLVTPLASLPAAAQCVLCYKSVEGAGSRTIEVLKVGILILLVPTLFIFSALGLMVYRRRKTPGGEVTVLPGMAANYAGDPLAHLPSPTESASR